MAGVGYLNNPAGDMNRTVRLNQAIFSFVLFAFASIQYLIISIFQKISYGIFADIHKTCEKYKIFIKV